MTLISGSLVSRKLISGNAVNGRVLQKTEDQVLPQRQ